MTTKKKTREMTAEYFFFIKWNFIRKQKKGRKKKKKKKMK